MQGHHAAASVVLHDHHPIQDPKYSPCLAEGNQSWQDLFGPPNGDSPRLVRFGGIIEHYTMGPDRETEITVWFWADRTRLFATPGKQFQMTWNGEVCGTGEITSVLDSTSDLEPALTTFESPISTGAF